VKKSYAETVDSGFDWLGRIPVHWKLSPLGSHFVERSEMVSDSDFPALSVTMGGVVPQLENVAKTTNNDKRKLVRAGDFAINSRSDRKGAAGLANLDGSVSVVYSVLKLRASIDGRFAHHLLRSPAFQEEFYRWGSGIVADLWSTRYSTMKRIHLALPPIEEQRVIAAYLDRETARIDTLIEEQKRLVELLRERRTAVISSALSPADSWARLRIKYIGETNLGKMLDAGRNVREGDRSRPYVRAADVRADGSVNLLDLNEMPFSDAEMDYFDLRAGDVLLIEGGATVGRPGYVSEPAQGVAFQKTVNRLRVGPRAEARFAYWSMLLLYESAYYTNHYGSVSFVHLTGEKLREIELYLPPLDEQRSIAAYLDEQTVKIDALIAETERFIELARERRSALITAAVTGQIDVREIA